MFKLFTCKDVTERASAYVGRELSFIDRVKYRLHLFICHDCRNFLAQFRLTLAALRKVKQPAPTAATDDQIAALLNAHRTMHEQDK